MSLGIRLSKPFFKVIRRNVRTSTQETLYQALIVEKGKSRYPISLTLHNLLDIASARDIFQLQLSSSDTTFHNERSDTTFILVREKQIILSIGCIKAIIMNKKMILLDYHLPIVKDLAIQFESDRKSDRLNITHGNAFFLHCLEEILIYQCELFERRMRLIHPLIKDLCSTNMRTQTNVDGNPRLQKVMTLQDSLTSFSDQLRHTKDAIVEILKTPDDMHSIITMDEEENPVQKIAFDLERILECYASTLTRLLQSNNYNIAKLERRQSAAIFYDNVRRTKIIQLNLNISLATLTLSSLGSVAGIFGMNISNGLENSSGIFLPMVAGMVVGAVGIHTFLMQRVNDTLMHADLEKHAQSMAAIQKVMKDTECLDLAIKNAFKLLDEDDPHSMSVPLVGSPSPSPSPSPSAGPNPIHSIVDDEPMTLVSAQSSAPPPPAPIRKGISKETFTHLVMAAQRKKGLLTPGNIDSFFDLIDTDKDGFIEKNEIYHLKL